MAEAEPRSPTRRETEAADPTDAPEGAIEQRRIRDYFSWRPLPWWICFFAGIFLLTKFQIVYNDSECAVLGTQSPVSQAEVKKAFRTLSMCTHPDRLRGRLKRQPTLAEERRGEIIFNRASAAKDSLIQKFKGKKKTVPCYEGELELAVVLFFAQVGMQLQRLGVSDYVSFVMDLFWNIVTFEAGFMNTILSLLWFVFCLRILKQFLGYLWRLGMIRGVVALVTTVIIGPIPTLVNLIILPCLRFYVFLKKVIVDLRPEVEAKEDPDSPTTATATADASAQDEERKPPKISAAMRRAAEANKELPNRGIRRRNKKDTEEDKEKRKVELLEEREEVPPEQENEIVNVPGGRMPEGIWKCINWTVPEPVKARQAAATATQFDMLLILTKPIIPLFMLITCGQVWNGLFSSLIVGHALRKWVPQMSYEAHHLLCMFFGLAHTLLGVNANQVEEFANREGKKVLALTWGWTFKDVLCVMHMCLLGSTFKAISSMGNEPAFASSFAAGIALRIAMGQDSVKGLGAFQFASSKVEAALRSLDISLQGSEEVVAYSGDGIGDCAGGPFRMLFGDGSSATWAARLIKVWLMILPLMATGQWLLRTIHAGKMLGRRKKTTRFVQRLILFIMGLLQCILLANLELNSSNGALGNFWVAMLFGCIGESLFCIFDVRGHVRQLVFLLLFLFI